MTENTSPSLGILLANTGTPDAPTAWAVRRYLAQFLGDRRVIELPRWWWLPLLHGIILTFRPRRSARLYRRVWTAAGSPLLVNTDRLADGLRRRLAAGGQPILVEVGMRYGNPSIASALRRLQEQGARRLVVLPLFPQYSATTSGAILDAVFDELKTWRHIPPLRVVEPYYAHPAYIQALAHSLRSAWEADGPPDRLLLSFHGIPLSYVQAGDPYPQHCGRTAELLAAALDLPPERWSLSYQSRFGPQQWLGPGTQETLLDLGRQAVRRLDAACPGFAADCLETLDEIAHEGRQAFAEAGGGEFRYLPALNDRPAHVEALAQIVEENLAGWNPER